MMDSYGRSARARAILWSVDALDQGARSTSRCLIRSQWWIVFCVRAQTSTTCHVEFWRVSVLSLLDYCIIKGAEGELVVRGPWFTKL